MDCKGANTDDEMATIDIADQIAPPPPSDLKPCLTCGRKFNSVSLSKHVAICKKMATKKRRAFDSSRQRREGTEMAAFLPKNFGLPASKQVPEQNTGDEKIAHSVSRTSVDKEPNNAQEDVPSSRKPKSQSKTRVARQPSTERPKRGQPPAPASEQCPHCERYFGLKAYDRHVEWCKEKFLQASMKSSNCSEKKRAMERLAARTKYRAPIKAKRNLNLDKYAGSANDVSRDDESTKVCSSNARVTNDGNEDDNISECSLKSSKNSTQSFERTLALKEDSDCESNAAAAIDTTKQDEMCRVNRKQRIGTPRPSHASSGHNENNCQQFVFPNKAPPMSLPQPMIAQQLPTSFNDMSPNIIFTQPDAFHSPNIFQTVMNQQQQQLQASYQDMMNTFRMNRRSRNAQRKSQRLSLGSSGNPGTPLKAFGLPLDGIEMLDKTSPPYEFEKLDDFESPDWTKQQLNSGGDGDASTLSAGTLQSYSIRKLEKASSTSLSKPVSNTDAKGCSSRDSMYDCKETFNDTTKTDDYFSARSDDSQADLHVQQRPCNFDHHKKTSVDEFNANKIFLNVNSNESEGLIHKSVSSNVLNTINVNDNAKVGDDVKNVYTSNNQASSLIEQVQANREGQEHILAAPADSDEVSSFDDYSPTAVQSIGDGFAVTSKSSEDSAFESLSCQNMNNTVAANTVAAAAAHMPQNPFLLQQHLILQQRQQQLQYAHSMLQDTRSRHMSASSSSGSDNSMPPPPPIFAENFYQFQQQQQLLMQQQHQQMLQMYYNKVESNCGLPTKLVKASPNTVVLNAQSARPPTAGAHIGKSMSRFCYACGRRFLVDQAKFCTNCGTKRLMI